MHFYSDVDECADANGGCDTTCINSIGSFKCQCGVGYTLEKDEKKCSGNLPRVF